LRLYPDSVHPSREIASDLPLEDLLTDTLTTPVTKRSSGAAYARNVMLTGSRLVIFAVIGVLLPAFLTHRLSTVFYGAWILVLQLASYVGYLDLGAQTGISKYIAEYKAKGDREACSEHASAGLAITMTGGTVGVLVSIVLAWQVPVLFRDMPAAIAKDVSHGVLLVGISTAVLLATSAIGGIFLGLERFSVPVMLGVGNKLVYCLVLIVMVLQHRSLTAMGISMAVANLLTATVQVGLWHRLIPQIKLRFNLLSWPIVRRMLAYCGVLGIWTSGMILISGLDTTIVGHYRFGETAYYAIAAAPVVFLNQILMAALAPLTPATSALSVNRSPKQLGSVLDRSVRYTMLIQFAVAMPMVLFGYKLLSVWVGPEYARHSLLLMRVLLLANVIRNICLPYCGMVLATGMQRYATLSGVCEAVVNLGTSLLLGRMYGALGVALGTLIGAIVGVAVHFVLSMRRTQCVFEMSPSRLLMHSVVWPSVVSIPTLLVLPIFWQPSPVVHALPIAAAWVASSIAMLWMLGLRANERTQLLNRLKTR
jgi:O-antigen/teichoic acid export membrane protein